MCLVFNVQTHPLAKMSIRRVSEMSPLNADYPAYFEVSLKQNGLLDHFGIPKYSLDNPNVCAVPMK